MITEKKLNEMEKQIDDLLEEDFKEYTKKSNIANNTTKEWNELADKYLKNPSKEIQHILGTEETQNNSIKWIPYEEAMGNNFNRKSNIEPSITSYGHSIYSAGINSYSRPDIQDPPISEMQYGTESMDYNKPGVSGQVFSVQLAEEWTENVLTNNEEVPPFGQDEETVTVSPTTIADYAMGMATRFAIYCLDYTYQLNRWYVNGDGLNNGLTTQELYFKFLDETEW